MAQTASPKIATDLSAAIAAASTPKLSWAKDVNGARRVKGLIVSNTDDAELTALRAAVMAAGGSIDYRYSSVLALALAAMLPADKVNTIAARTDVQSISPKAWRSRRGSDHPRAQHERCWRRSGRIGLIR